MGVQAGQAVRDLYGVSPFGTQSVDGRTRWQIPHAMTSV